MSNEKETLIIGDHNTWLTQIWNTLHQAQDDRDGGIPDEEWDEITTAMAWITERLDATKGSF